MPLLVAGHLLFAQQSSEEEQIETISEEISTKLTLQAEKTRQRGILRDEITNLKAEIDKLNLDRINLKQEVEQAERAIDNNSTLAEQGAQRLDRSARDLVWTFITSKQLEKRSPVAMLVLENEPLKLDRLYNYHLYFQDHLNEQINQHGQVVNELREERTRIRKSRDSAESSRLVLERNTTTLEDRTQRLALMEEQLEIEVEAINLSIRELLLQRQELNQLIAERTQPSSRANEVPTPASREDVSNWPVEGEILQGFGVWRADGRIQTEGITISATQHSPINAIANGVVVFAQWLEGYKNTVIVDHGNEVISVYAYCETLLKEVDEPVEAGEPIATVGLADQFGAAGLYFEIRVRNKPNNPLEWLSSR